MLQLGHIKNSAFFQRLLRRKSQTKVIKFTIPKDYSSASALTHHIDQVVKDRKTWVYIDTSFLMWLAKIGPSSRQQCFDWLEAKFPDRICVPVWAAHEFLRHHSLNSISDDLGKQCKHFGKIARKGYLFFRPFLDPISDQDINTAFIEQVQVRKVFKELEEVSKLANNLKKELKKKGEAVITFINKHTPSTTNVFEVINGIESWGSERYDGRIPPGFKDKNKKGVETDDEDDEDGTSYTGTNKFGDLIFWKEILKDASQHKAKNAIILTNDQKTDWQMSARKVPTDADLIAERGMWKPYPIPHPMLSYEAGLTAKLEEVVLLDAVYLGKYLKDHDWVGKTELIDVALVPDQPYSPPANGNGNPANGLAITDATSNLTISIPVATSAANAITTGTDTAAQKYRFEELFTFPNPYLAIRDAWKKSSKPINQTHTLHTFILKVNANFIEQLSIADLMTKQNLAGLDLDAIVALGRWIHDTSLTNILGSPEAPTDVLSILNELPPFTASAIYMGFVGSMYFESESRKPRIPPLSRVDDLIYGLRHENYAKDPLLVIEDSFKKESKQPLFVLSLKKDKVNVTLSHTPESDGEFILGSIKVDETEVYSPAQVDPYLNLRRLNRDEESISPWNIVKSACQIYGIPIGCVELKSDFNLNYQLIPTAGFRSPKTSYITKEKA